MRPALTSADVAMRRAVVEGLYVDAMLLADEAQALFVAVRDGDALPPRSSGGVSDEALPPPQAASSAAHRLRLRRSSRQPGRRAR